MRWRKKAIQLCLVSKSDKSGIDWSDLTGQMSKNSLAGTIVFGEAVFDIYAYKLYNKRRFICAWEDKKC
ncbi:hypothetical protein SELR_20040 [Selenomonas ruminantium subsp. lactilytica TAM6421]|uniref:Uncharacterized protein n=1 Tax=Selenomonas ruminantium subsp. lactilytica (strain NBRC 103574 / TAM6421) TaxID=927704 RepID=I0GSH5_SELRL|nr:hypothetical protein SELR_20040 [Selenomonas ruminantium subsp. lactilytica TAM6421]